MDGPVPVFSNNDDARSWKELSTIEKNLRKRSRFRSKDRFERILSEYDDMNDINPWVACKILDLMMKLPSVDRSRRIQRIIRRCRASDSIPRIKAAELLMGMSDHATAASILDEMTVRNDLSQWEYHRGLICKAMGETQAAISHLVRSYEADDTFMPVYDELISLTSDDAWVYRRDIMSMLRGDGTPPIQGEFECPMRNLCEIYRESILSGYGAAISSLRTTSGYVSGDTDHILAMARFLHGSGDHQASIAEYLRINDGRLSISMELVSVYADAGMLDEAIALCKATESVGPGDRRILESLIRLSAKEEDIADMAYYMEVYRCEDYVDSDGYIMMVRLMIPLSMHANADQLIHLMEMSGVDETITLALSSENDYAARSYARALVSITKALNNDPTNPDYRLHRIRVLAALNDPKVMLEINDVLRKDPRNIHALDVKKNILLKRKDYEAVLQVCGEMRSLRPDDAGIISDMAVVYGEMGRTEESLKAYRESLGMRVDPTLFMDVIKRLVTDGRYEDAVSLVGEYDDSYGMIPGSWVLRGNAEYALGRYSDAVESYDRALELDHGDHRVWHSRGMAAEAIRDYEKAESSYDRAILLDLDNEEYWISKSIVQEKKGDHSGAIRSLNKVIDEHPENPYVLMRKAHILSGLGKNRESMIFVELALKISPNNVDMLRAKRDLYVRERDIDAADKVYSKMIRLDPNNDGLRLEHAGILCDNRRYTKALKVLDDMNDPDTPDALRIRRSIHMAEGPQDDLVRTCVKIYDRDPKDRENLMILARAYDDIGKRDEALKIYDILKESDPGDVEATIGVARMSEDQDSALSAIDASLKDDPNDQDLLFEASDILMSCGRYREANVYLDRAIDTEPDSPGPYIRRARLQIRYGLYDEAIATIEGAMRSVIIQDPELWLCLGDAQAEMGDNADALASYDNVLGYDDTYKGIHTRRGLVLLAMGSVDEARDSFETAYRLNERDTMAMSQLAMIHIDEGKMNVASRYIQDSLAIDPFFGPALVADVKYNVMRSDFEKAKEIADTAEMHGGVEPRYIQSMRRMLTVAPEDTVADDVPSEEMETYARALIQRSYDDGTDMSDPATAAAASIPVDRAEDVLHYISDIQPFGAVVPGTPEFERMERLSHDAIVNGELIDIDRSPLIPLYSAVFESGAKDVEEGKRLISYVYEVMTINMDPAEYDRNISTIVSHMEYSKYDESIYLIMERYDVGIFAARTALMLHEKGSVVGNI